MGLNKKGFCMHIILDRPIEGMQVIKAFDLAVKIARLSFHWKVMVLSEAWNDKEKRRKYGAVAYLSKKGEDVFKKESARIILVPIFCRRKTKIHEVEIVIVAGHEKVMDPLWNAESYPKRKGPCWQYADDFEKLATEFKKLAARTT